MSNDHLNTIDDWPHDPLALFDEWYKSVQADDSVPEPEAMALATATPDGHPSVRMVLLRGHDENGFCFYTNYESRKGQELIANPWASAVFYWREPYLQIRVAGPVEKLSDSESDTYFNSRSRARRTSAIVSNQSHPITDWRELRTSANELLNSNEPAERPNHWGGFRIRPTAIEFWAGSQDRMHRRCLYELESTTWHRQLLAP